VAVGAASALSACGGTSTSSNDEPSASTTTATDGLPITVAGYSYDRVQALINGRVSIDGCNVTFQKGSIGDLNTHVFDGPRTIEVTEIGLHPYHTGIRQRRVPRLQPAADLSAAHLSAQERAYFAKTGIFPIMHAVAVRDDVIEKHPWLPEALFSAYSRAKQINQDHLRKLGWAMVLLPWAGQELEETQKLMGDNYWPYGIGPNRETLEALFRYSHDQGLASRELTIEELFHPKGLALTE